MNTQAETPGMQMVVLLRFRTIRKRIAEVDLLDRSHSPFGVLVACEKPEQRGKSVVRFCFRANGLDAKELEVNERAQSVGVVDLLVRSITVHSRVVEGC